MIYAKWSPEEDPQEEIINFIPYLVKDFKQKSKFEEFEVSDIKIDNIQKFRDNYSATNF